MHKFFGLILAIVVLSIFRGSVPSTDTLFIGMCIMTAGFLSGGTK